MADHDRRVRAAARSRVAEHRVRELRRLLRRLRGGARLDESDLSLAALRAGQSAQLAEVAAQDTDEARQRAADAHRSAAAAFDQAGRPAEAQRHRAAAIEDEAAARGERPPPRIGD